MSNLADILAERGSALLGAGGFSIVVVDPECPWTAIKIGPSLADPWPAWAAFALDHGGPHVPRVADLARDIAYALDAGDDALALRMKLWLDGAFALARTITTAAPRR